MQQRLPHAYGTPSKAQSHLSYLYKPLRARYKSIVGALDLYISTTMVRLEEVEDEEFVQQGEKDLFEDDDDFTDTGQLLSSAFLLVAFH